MEIVWSEEALLSYFKVIDHLLEKWTMVEIVKFEIDVDLLLERLKANPEMCPKSRLLNFRKCIVDEQNSLIYSIVNQKIFLITFVDNRSFHSY